MGSRYIKTANFECKCKILQRVENWKTYTFFVIFMSRINPTLKYHQSLSPKFQRFLSRENVIAVAVSRNLTEKVLPKSIKQTEPKTS